MCRIWIGNDQDFLEIKFHRRTAANAQDYWNANWLHCTVTFSAGQHRRQSEWQLRNEDLARFLSELEDLNARIGEAHLHTLDDWLDVRIIHDEKGHIVARCQVQEDPSGGHFAECQLPLELKDIPSLATQIREVLKRFPVIARAR
jgi:hypothetical protein